MAFYQEPQVGILFGRGDEQVAELQVCVWMKVENGLLEAEERRAILFFGEQEEREHRERLGDALAAVGEVDPGCRRRGAHVHREVVRLGVYPKLAPQQPTRPVVDAFQVPRRVSLCELMRRQLALDARTRHIRAQISVAVRGGRAHPDQVPTHIDARGQRAGRDTLPDVAPRAHRGDRPAVHLDCEQHLTVPLLLNRGGRDRKGMVLPPQSAHEALQLIGEGELTKGPRVFAKTVLVEREGDLAAAGRQWEVEEVRRSEDCGLPGVVPADDKGERPERDLLGVAKRPVTLNTKRLQGHGELLGAGAQGAPRRRQLSSPRRARLARACGKHHPVGLPLVEEDREDVVWVLRGSAANQTAPGLSNEVSRRQRSGSRASGAGARREAAISRPEAENRGRRPRAEGTRPAAGGGRPLAAVTERAPPLRAAFTN